MVGSSFGIMQGRLSPMRNNAYQAFPTGEWQREFDLAPSWGFQHIEWVIDSESLDDNPLVSSTAEVQSVVNRSGVCVVSVCGDFLMNTPLDVDTPRIWEYMDRLIDAMCLLNATYLVIPSVDQSSALDVRSRARLSRAIEHAEQRYHGRGIGLALETDLPPTDFYDLLKTMNPEFVGVNYDIGNSASLGYSPEKEFASYGERIALVHVKDRVRNGFSVPLGAGDAEIGLVLRLLQQVEFAGPVTMQSFRDQEGLKVLDEQVEFWRRMTDGIT